MMYDPTSSLPFPEVFKELTRLLPYFFINPSGLNIMSTRSKEVLVRSRETLAKFLRCANSEIIFTSSSTESNNLAIKGSVFGRTGSIITTDFEHPSIHHPLRSLEKQGFEVIYVETDEKGWVDPKRIKEYIREDTLLLTMGAVCRETATFRNVNSIVDMVKETKPDVLCHFDMWGLYYPDSFLELKKVDMASFDSPTLLGPVGIGFLYVKKGVRLKPLVEGGTQERGIRAGEGNLFGICALSLSVRFLIERRSAVEKSLAQYDEYVVENLSFLTPAFKKDWKVPGLFSYGISNIEVEMLISLLEKRGFFLNQPSPCMVNGLKSRIRQKCGFEDLVLFRIPPFTPLAEVEEFLKTLEKCVITA